MHETTEWTNSQDICRLLCIVVHRFILLTMPTGKQKNLSSFVHMHLNILRKKKKKEPLQMFIK